MGVAAAAGDGPDFAEATRRMRAAAAANKCWACGCLHNALVSLDRAMPASQRPADLDAAIDEARKRLVPARYDCLGCEVCHPPLAMNALHVGAAACPTDDVAAREGWPPLPGAYRALRYGAPVAICTLTDEALAEAVALRAPPEVAIVGSLHTENLGIERIVRNTLADPNIRFLVLAGADSRQTIGHLPGQSLTALAANGVDDQGRIVGAKGRRPILRNLPEGAVEHFRRTVDVIDRIGSTDAEEIVVAARGLGERAPGPAEPFDARFGPSVIRGSLPERMTGDPAGYFVVYVDARRRILVLEHYRDDGTLNVVVEGRTAAEAYTPAVDGGLVSRLDHAAYLGRELARAEAALSTGSHYVQDGAPERASTLQGPATSCGCGPGCSG